VGFVDPGSVDIKVYSGTTTFVFNLVRTTAPSFVYYGYPTNLVPGISFTPSSGGISSLGYVSTSVYVSNSVNPGIYSGFQKLYSTSSAVYALIPVKVEVIAPNASLVISNVKVGNITNTSVMVNWTTNQQSTSLVKYGLSSTKLSMQTNEDKAVTISHTVNLSNLQKGKRYYYQVFSRDIVGNLVTDGKTYSFMTTISKTNNILAMVVK
jgi:hypothetical protein